MAGRSFSTTGLPATRSMRAGYVLLRKFGKLVLAEDLRDCRQCHEGGVLSRSHWHRVPPTVQELVRSIV